MRFKEKKLPKEGSIKTERSFLLLPLTIGGETRWLEFANIRLKFYHNRPSGGGWGSPPDWYFDSWADDREVHK
jgi:hypothetical protein